LISIFFLMLLNLELFPVRIGNFDL
jgi:hypothetical protein